MKSLNIVIKNNNYLKKFNRMTDIMIKNYLNKNNLNIIKNILSKLYKLTTNNRFYLIIALTIFNYLKFEILLKLNLIKFKNS